MDFTLTASKECYQNYSSNVDISPGETVVHNVVMKPILNSLWGKLVDSSTGEPIIGALVTLDEHSTTTNSSGDFMFTDFFIETNGKTIIININYQNYDNIEIQRVLDCGDQTDLETIQMQPILSILEGTVIDSSTSNPIESVKLTLDGYETTSDASGRFKFENIKAF